MIGVSKMLTDNQIVDMMFQHLDDYAFGFVFATGFLAACMIFGMWIVLDEIIPYIRKRFMNKDT